MNTLAKNLSGSEKVSHVPLEIGLTQRRKLCKRGGGHIRRTENNATALAVCLRKRVGAEIGIWPLQQLSTLVLRAPVTALQIWNTQTPHFTICSFEGVQEQMCSLKRRKPPKVAWTKSYYAVREELKKETNSPGINSGIVTPIHDCESRWELNRDFPRRTAETPIGISRQAVDTWTKWMLLARDIQYGWLYNSMCLRVRDLRLILSHPFSNWILIILQRGN